MLYWLIMSNKDSRVPAVLVDAMNGSGAAGMILVGILLLSNGMGDRQLPFLIIGLLLTVIGVFRIGYRLSKGKWFRLFGGRSPEGQ